MTPPPVPARILVVEDDAATSEFFVDLLSMAGYATHVAASGQAALAVLRAHPVNVVLLDRWLPDMDGLAVCRAIRAAIDATVPIILLTAERSPGLEVAAQDAGITTYLLKPFLPDVLLERVAALLEA
jgi:two-component system response regulator MprA